MALRSSYPILKYGFVVSHGLLRSSTVTQTRTRRPLQLTVPP